MARVLVGYKLKTGADTMPILTQRRSSVLAFPGFVSAENLLRAGGETMVVMMSTWQRVED